MSGRDLRTFVTSHRVYSNANEPETLVRRVNDGLGSNKYSSVDYEKLRAMAAEKKFSSHKSLIKMKKIEQISKQSKENNTLKQHKMVWQQEFARLLSQRKRLQAEMDVLSRACLLDSTCAGIFQDLEDFESFLSSDFARFKEDTATPVWALREDLQFWLTENQAELRNGTPAAVDKHAEIRCTVDNVRQQQQVILDRLHHDQLALEQELKTGSLGELFTTHGKEARLPREQGIPEEAFDLECHDPEFKASVIQEFILIDQRHLERLSRLEEQHEAVLREDENGGWNPEDHFVFQAIHEQYAPDLPNRRALLLDRLAKHLPCKTRFHVLEHERWWLGYKYYCSRHRSILHDWQRDRREMMTKAKLVFAESCVTHSLNMALGDCRQKQKDLCKSLYEKVCRWREQKEEALRLEARIEDRRRAEALEQERREVEREKKRRRADKEKIVGYRDDLAKQKAQSEEEEQRKLEEMQRLLAEQAEYDRERVKYREEMVHRKGEERRMREEEREREQEERERRLEALREQVRVVAETDPARLARNTEAWRNRLLGEEADVELQKPLFNVHTFTEKQVTADPRVRLEAKLREVGLMQTDYARHVMSQVKPAHQPRRDTESTVFKLDR